MSYFTVSLIMVVLLLLKGFFSGSEIALVSADKIRMRHKARLGSRGARLLLKMFQNPDRLLTTTLIGTNIATVSLTTMGTLMMVALLGERGDFFAFLFFTPLLLIMGEIVPKSIYQQKAEDLSPVIVYPLRAASVLLFPLILLFSLIARLAIRILGAGKAAQSVFLTREQLRAVLEMTEKRSDVRAFSRGRIRKAIRFGEVQAAEAMTPLRDLSLLGLEENTGKLQRVVQQLAYRPVPVYEGNTANIVGVISLGPWDLMGKDLTGMAVADLAGRPYYAAPQQNLAELLPVIRKRKDQTAIIVDEYGSAMGMLTTEDILEVVVGEVKIGYHFEKHPYRHQRTFEIIEEDVYLLDGRLSISDVNDVIGLNLSTETCHTIGGMFPAYLKHIPREGEQIVDSGYRFTAVETTEKGVVTVRAEPEI
jgi:CBS domain containing-hemolysin-like protein